MLRFALLAALAAATLSPVHAQTSTPPPPSAGKARSLQYLLDSAADDFNGSALPKPLQVRDVRLAWVPKKAGERQYLLCGQFSPQGAEGEWSDFATIHTSRYEQWTGATATGLCKRDNLTWETDAGLTEKLQGALK